MSKYIPFLDLTRELVSIKEEIKTKIDTIFFEKTNFILGDELETFENNFAKYIDVKYCIGVANGTDAVEIAVNSLNLNKDDEIITQSNTYVATCFGVTNNNITLKLADIDENTYQLDLDEHSFTMIVGDSNQESPADSIFVLDSCSSTPYLDNQLLTRKLRFKY